MLDSLFKDGLKQLANALIHKKRPFRYFTLTTVSLDGSPHSRTVVLRGFDSKKFTFSIYTDSRSEKIKELDNDQRAEFLFYDSNQLLQVTVKASLIDRKVSKVKFENLPEPSKRDYSSIQQPGAAVKAPDSVQYNYNKGHFVELQFQASEIEYLKLKRPNHLRARFYADRTWQGEFLAP